MGQRNLTEIGLIKARYYELMADFEFRQLPMTKAVAYLKEEGMTVSYPTLHKWCAELKTLHAEEWLEAARKRTAPKSIQVDDALFMKAAKGDVEAIKTWYAKNENWSQKQVSEITNVNPEARGATDEELVEQFRKDALKKASPEQLAAALKDKELKVVEPEAGNAGS